MKRPGVYLGTVGKVFRCACLFQALNRVKAFGGMFLVILMIFDAEAGWSRAVESARSIVRVLFLHLFPLLLLGCVAEGFGMMRWGKHVGQFGTMKTFTLEEVMRYQACHFGVGLVVVCFCALVLRGLSNTFHVRQTFAQGLTVCVFGLGPVFLMRVFDAFPSLFPWIAWIIGAALAAGILYHGVPRVMWLDPAHAFGVYMSSAMVLVLASGLGRVLVIYILQPKVLGIPPAF